MNYTKLLSVSFFFFFIISQANTQTHFYVDSSMGDDNYSGLHAEFPKKTIQSTINEVRKYTNDMTSNIYINIRKGIYYINSDNQASSFSFTSADSGSNGYSVIYRAVKNEKVIFSAGKKLDTRWGHIGGNVIASYDNFDWKFRQIYVNQKRYNLARSDENFFNNFTFFSEGPGKIGFIVDKDTIPYFKANKHTEFVFFDKWKSKLLRIDSITSTNEISKIYFKSPEYSFIGPSDNYNSTAPVPYYFSNSYDLLGPNEFYLDYTETQDGTVFNAQAFFRISAENYFNENDTNLIIAPYHNRIVTMIGDSNNPVHDISFEGISFQHTNWTKPSEQGLVPDITSSIMPYNNEDQNLYPNSVIPGAIYLEYTNNILFRNCEFKNLGAEGIELYKGVKNTWIIENYFGDISGGAISLFTSGIVEIQISTPQLFTEVNQVSNNNIIGNLIENCGIDYQSTSGIFIPYGTNNLIQNNTIRNLPYSGIFLGFGWSNDAYFNIDNNKIIKNNIYNVMSKLCDGGAILNNGNHNDSGINFNRTIITENYIHSITRNNRKTTKSPVAGIYFDDGASGIYAFYNVIDIEENKTYKWHQIFYNEPHMDKNDVEVQLNHLYDVTPPNKDYSEIQRIINHSGIDFDNSFFLGYK